MKENIIEVVADSGCQSFFFPLFTQDSVETPLRDTVWSLPENFEEWNADIPDSTKTSILESLSSGNIAWNVIPEIPYIRYQFARRKYNLTASIVGIAITVETNQDHDGTGGFFLKEELVPRDDERQTMVAENGILRQPPSPYNAVAINSWVLNKIPKAAANPTQGIVPSEDGGIKIPLDSDRTLEFEFFVGFKNPDTEQPCDVDLIIDFGNSRTMALLLNEGRLADRNGADSIGRIRQHCVPVLLKLSDKKAIFKKDLHDVNNGVVSSSFVLHETQFSRSLKLLQRKLKAERLPCGFLGLGRKMVVTSEVQRVSNMFVQVSPVLLGDEADDCLHDAAVISSLTQHGAMVQQSSPKRYFWDKRRPRHNWDMVPNYIPEMSLTLPPLEADILQWMDENGEFVDLENPEKEASKNPLSRPGNPNYPRSATFIWMFVGILERAWKQCNSFSFGTNKYEQFVLKNIIVTYPAGWSGDELDRYRSLCRASVDIFRKNHFGRNVDIKLDMELDEAVASQLPFVFSEIHEFGDNAEGWLNFAGKQRNGRNTVRILNFDIGGGTSDISLLEYEDLDDETDYTRLQPRLLYKNGFSTAGDEVLRLIIGTIVLKGIAEKNTNVSSKQSSQLLKELNEFFRISKDENYDIKRARVVKQCLVPIAIAIMKDLGRPDSNSVIKLENIGITADQWDNEFRDDFLKNLDGMPPLDSLEISYDKTEVDQIIRGAFEDGFKFLAELANNYDVDLFFSSGKTSELPVIQELAMQYIPLTPERIVTAKNYRAGDWYPFANPAENTIKDAKSVTAVGAALFHILSGQNRHLVDNWQILPTVIDITSNFEWGLLNRTDFSLSNVFEFSDDANASVNLRPGRIIAKRLSQNSKPDAVYRFSPKDERSTMNQLCTVQLKRLIDEEKHTERLRLISVIDPDGRDVTNDFELALFQYADEKALWQDTGRIL